MSVCLKLRESFTFMVIGELSCIPAGVRFCDTKSRGIGLVHRFELQYEMLTPTADGGWIFLKVLGHFCYDFLL